MAYAVAVTGADATRDVPACHCQIDRARIPTQVLVDFLLPITDHPCEEPGCSRDHRSDLYYIQPVRTLYYVESREWAYSRPRRGCLRRIHLIVSAQI